MKSRSSSAKSLQNMAKSRLNFEKSLIKFVKKTFSNDFRALVFNDRLLIMPSCIRKSSDIFRIIRDVL